MPFQRIPSSKDVTTFSSGSSTFMTLARGSRFRYSGRTEREILENKVNRNPPDFSRYAVKWHWLISCVAVLILPSAFYIFTVNVIVLWPLTLITPRVVCQYQQSTVVYCQWKFCLLHSDAVILN